MIKILLNILPIILSVAFMTLMERKILGITSQRLSPQKLIMMGITQPISDAVKLANKESNKMSNSSSLLFSMTSMTFLMITITLWNSNMTNPQPISIKNNMLFIIMMLSINTSIIIFMGWSSYSKYSLMGAIRCAAQTISYEAVLMMIMITMIFLMKSFNSYSEQNLCNTIVVSMPIMMILWLPTVLAEMNRSPYDFSESESELVSGFNTEFGSKEFSMLFMAEYSNIIFMMMITAMLFTGSLTSMMFLMIWVLWIRSVLPRLRFDKLMMMAWKILIPLSTMMVMVMIMVS